MERVRELSEDARDIGEKKEGEEGGVGSQELGIPLESQQELQA